VAAACAAAGVLLLIGVRAVAAEPVDPTASAAVRRTTTTTVDRSEGDIPITEPTTVAPTTAPTTTAPTTAAPPTTAVPSTTVAAALEERVSDSEAATTRLNRAVIGLLALAALVTVATIVFWRMTRPDRRRREEAPAAHWVDDDGDAVPLRPDPTAAALVADPDAWSVGAPAAIPTPTLDPPSGPQPVVRVSRARSRAKAEVPSAPQPDDTGAG
jgi:hypothetical protein